MDNIVDIVNAKTKLNKTDEMINNIASQIGSSISAIFPIRKNIQYTWGLDTISVDTTIRLCNETIKSNKTHSVVLLLDMEYDQQKDMLISEVLFVLQPYTFIKYINDHYGLNNKFIDDIKYRFSICEKAAIDITEDYFYQFIDGLK